MINAIVTILRRKINTFSNMFKNGNLKVVLCVSINYGYDWISVDCIMPMHRQFKCIIKGIDYSL